MSKIKSLMLIVMALGLIYVFTTIFGAGERVYAAGANPQTGDVAVTVALITAGVAGFAGYRLRKSNSKKK